MAMIKDEAIVLRKLDYSETSQVVALFTRSHGKVRVIAKGIKRSTKVRFAAALDLLDVGHAVFSVRHARQEALATLTEWTQARACSGVRTRLDRLYAAQYAAALTAELTEDWDPHARLYASLDGLLDALASADDTLPVVVGFQRALLDDIGSLPIFEACVACGAVMPSGGDLYFSSLEGGMLCRDCEAARSEKCGVWRPAWAVLSGKQGAAGDAERKSGMQSAWRVFDYHLTHLMGKALALGRMYAAAV